MPGKLDLIVEPWKALDPTKPQAHGIYRDDPYTLVVNAWTDETKTTGRDLSAGSWQAQIRTARIPGAAAPDPLVQFAVDATDAASGVLVVSLTRDETKALTLQSTASAFWELQDETSGETLLTGKIKIFDDAGRPA